MLKRIRSADMPENPLLLSTAIEAVIKAGEIQMGFIDSGFADLAKRHDRPGDRGRRGRRDDVPENDRGALSRITRSSPRNSGRMRRHAARRIAGCSIPIDGTNNYAHGLPIFCASLALEIDGTGEIGAIYDPTRKELFVAERGGGAFLNGRPIHVSNASTLVESMLVTGFPYDIHKRIPEIVGLFGEFVGKARAVRRLGSAALDLCYVAAGRMDGFWEQDLKPWDIAAGAIIVEEAGGTCDRLCRRTLLVATAPDCSPPTGRSTTRC